MITSRKINLRCSHYFDFNVKIATHHSFTSSSLPRQYFNELHAASRCLRFIPYEAISYGFIFCNSKNQSITIWLAIDSLPPTRAQLSSFIME